MPRPISLSHLLYPLLAHNLYRSRCRLLTAFIEVCLRAQYFYSALLRYYRWRCSRPGSRSIKCTRRGCLSCTWRTYGLSVVFLDLLCRLASLIFNVYLHRSPRMNSLYTSPLPMVLRDSENSSVTLLRNLGQQEVRPCL